MEPTNRSEPRESPADSKRVDDLRQDAATRSVAGRAAWHCLAGVILLWLAGPPMAMWPFALVALVPWLMVAGWAEPLGRRGHSVVWIVSTAYWLVSLEGLRHAHPAMYACWIALAAYLAIYHVAFVWITSRISRAGLPLFVVAPVVWVATEVARNYVITGISAAMLGHAMIPAATMIQIADLFGSYGVGFVVVAVNVAVYSALRVLSHRDGWTSTAAPIGVAAGLVLATFLYGRSQLSFPAGKPLATFALLQLDEPVEYEQSVDREVEIFQNYARAAVRAAGDADSEPIDVIVWPESMFTGGSPWMTADADAVVPPEAAMSAAEFQDVIAERQAYFVQRSGYVQALIQATTGRPEPPEFLAGCGIIHYGDSPSVYSGVVHIDGNGQLADWYGKTHLVMFGEYVPIVPLIPGLRSLIPPGMGLQTGPGAKLVRVGETTVAPNICIETAVERVTVNQMSDLLDRASGPDAGGLPDVIVTVTNDGWFDDSAVIDHHLRCAQMVAVAVRRPILSAANNGPTAWIDSSGRIEKRLATGTHGHVIAKPTADDRTSLYVRIGDWPAWACLALTAIGLATIVATGRSSLPADRSGDDARG